MKRKFFTAGEMVPVIERAWPNPEENIVVRYALREEEIKIVNGALALLYADMDTEGAEGAPAGKWVLCPLCNGGGCHDCFSGKCFMPEGETVYEAADFNLRREDDGTISIYYDHKFLATAANEPAPPPEEKQ